MKENRFEGANNDIGKSVVCAHGQEKHTYGLVTGEGHIPTEDNLEMNGTIYSKKEETDEYGTPEGARKRRDRGGSGSSRSDAKPKKDLRDFGGSESPYSTGAPRTAQSQLLSSGNKEDSSTPKEWGSHDERTSGGKSTGKKGQTDPFHERNEDSKRDNDSCRINARTGDVNWDQRFNDHKGKGAMDKQSV